MNLRDIRINGIYVPAGSILNLEHVQDDPVNGPDESLFLLPQIGIRSVGLLRVSAFALTDAWRRLYFAETFENLAPGISPNLMRNASIRDIEEAAQRMLDDYCSGGAWFDWVARREYNGESV
jgi:hypothetical protein